MNVTLVTMIGAGSCDRSRTDSDNEADYHISQRFSTVCVEEKSLGDINTTLHVHSVQQTAYYEVTFPNERTEPSV
jgi:hypothetical protein